MEECPGVMNNCAEAGDGKQLSTAAGLMMLAGALWEDELDERTWRDGKVQISRTLTGSFLPVTVNLSLRVTVYEVELGECKTSRHRGKGSNARVSWIWCKIPDSP